METRPAATSGLANHLAGVSSATNHSLERAALNPQAAHGSATGQNHFASIAPHQAMAQPSAGRVRHAEGPHTSTSPLSAGDADAPPPAKRARLTDDDRMLFLLLQIQDMGKDGVMFAGGLRALAASNDVPVSTLRKLAREDGTLTAKGQAKLDREVFAKIDLDALA
jgi:hypothetical protein